MDQNAAKIKSLQDIINLMDGSMMKGYQSKLPKKEPSPDMSHQAEEVSPAEMFESSGQEVAEPGEAEMDDETMQQLMKMYESEDEFKPAQSPVPINGVN